MEFIEEHIRQYAERHTQAESSTLQKLNRETNAKVLKPRMLSGHLQGRVLSMISHMVKPNKILEIGTYTGYSAICLAEGLQPGGIVHTIDVNEELEGMANNYFEESGYADKIEMHIGDAVDVVPHLNETWDLVFIDADKANYSIYYDLVIDRVNSGGFIIADNVLWSGKVTKDVKANDKDTEALVKFNRKVHDDPAVANVMLPIRDGLMILRKV